MKVYKFGGASVKNADAIKNLFSIVQKEKSELIIVVSAMDKTTNNLELVWEYQLNGNKEKALEKIAEINTFHTSVVNDLSIETGSCVYSGEFGAHMQVTLTNDGPVTIIIDSKNKDL